MNKRIIDLSHADVPLEGVYFVESQGFIKIGMTTQGISHRPPQILEEWKPLFMEWPEVVPPSPEEVAQKRAEIERIVADSAQRQRLNRSRTVIERMESSRRRVRDAQVS